MINAIAYDTHAEVFVTGEDHLEWITDFERFKQDIQSKDREYKSHKKVWIVKNLEHYIRVPYIKRALLDRDKQLKLFPTSEGESC